MRLLRKKTKTEKSLPLILSTQDGLIIETYPSRVVNTLRHMISRLVCTETFPQRLTIVSSLRQEGVSYISRALATTLANDMEVTICVVELNWWWPLSMPEALNTSGGLASVLKGDTSLDESIIRTELPNLDILPSGTLSLEKRTALARGSLLR
ncbi:MAG: CpsD/CapB family tyrosine-protein kinase, partial [Chloroflexi bacterium]|nr:CpsD/CapB family tyrosine-protein kinase [Chloroflexota bacterium]